MNKFYTCIALILLLAVTAAAQEHVLTVAGSGKPGTALKFTCTAKKLPNPNQVAFLGVSPLPGKTEFPFVTMNLAMPIWASGMGSLIKGSHSHKIMVPSNWPPALVIPFYAQSVIVTPKGGGYIAVVSNVVKFYVKG